MKKRFLGLLAMASMLFATSCSEEEVLSQSTGNEVKVTFTTELRNDVKSRAVGDDTDGIDQLEFAVYNENKQNLPLLNQTITTFEELEGGKKKATVTVVLVKGQTYSFAFWAQDKDYTAYDFDATTAKVSIDYGQIANNKLADAFFANINDYKVEGTFETNVTLKRPFAQVNFLTTQYDLNDAEAAGFTPSQSSIVVQNAATSLNVLDGSVEGNAEAAFTINDLISSETTTIKNTSGNYITWDKNNVRFSSSEQASLACNFRYLATAYFLPTEATAASTITTSMSVTGNTSAPVELTAEDITAQRNYRTNIYGNLLTSNGKFYITVDPEFNDDYNTEVEEPTTTVVATIAQANALFEKGNTNVEIQEAPTSDATLTLPNTSDDVNIKFTFDENASPAKITISYDENATQKPTNITVEGDGGELVIDAEESTVTVTGNWTSSTVSTADNTLIVPKGATITSLTLNKGNAEIYYGAVNTLTKAEGYNGKVTWLVDSGDQLSGALTKTGDIVKLVNDIAVDADNTITIASGNNITLELNNHTIAGISDQTGANRNMIDVRGTLTVENGTMTIQHTGDNMGWGNSTNVFNVTAGGILNIEDATIKNLGGSDMAFCVHLNNWGEVTLNAKNTNFESTYVGIRAFNSGNDMNNVTLENCNILTDNSCFWVHNYTAADFGNDTTKAEAAAKHLNLNFTNTTIARTNGSKSLIRFGFTNAIYFSSIEMNEVVAGTETALAWALANDKNVLLNNDITANVTVLQKENVSITIDGQNYTYNGTITVDGKSARYETAALTIQNVNFNAESISADAYINLGKSGDSNTRYTNNVTVKDCTFSTTSSEDVVAVKSYTGGDWNLNISGCTVNEGMHSMLQVTNVEKGLNIAGCNVYSKNGVNLNNTPALEMKDCTFDTKGYAIRVGVNGNTNNGVFNISDSTLESECEDGDAVIILRGNMNKSTLTLTNTTVTGTTQFTNDSGATVTIK